VGGQGDELNALPKFRSSEAPKFAVAKFEVPGFEVQGSEVRGSKFEVPEFGGSRFGSSKSGLRTTEQWSAGTPELRNLEPNLELRNFERGASNAGTLRDFEFRNLERRRNFEPRTPELRTPELRTPELRNPGTFTVSR
jgi:hypothetical protein